MYISLLFSQLFCKKIISKILIVLISPSSHTKFMAYNKIIQGKGKCTSGDFCIIFQMHACTVKSHCNDLLGTRELTIGCIETYLNLGLKKERNKIQKDKHDKCQVWKGRGEGAQQKQHIAFNPLYLMAAALILKPRREWEAGGALKPPNTLHSIHVIWRRWLWY